MHNTQQCGSFLESCFWVYKRIRRVTWLCMKTKGSGWGETSRLTSFHRHWCCVAAAPTLLPPGTRQKNLLTGMGWSMRIDSGYATAESANHDQHHTTIRTSNGEQTKDEQRACSHHRWSRSLKLCLAVCPSSWKQLCQMQRTIGQESMYTNIDMYDQRLNRETTWMNTLQMHLNPWQMSTSRHSCTHFKMERHFNCLQGTVSVSHCESQANNCEH